MRSLLPLLLLAGCAPVATLQPQPMPSGDRVAEGKFLFLEDFEAGADKWDLPPSGWRLLNAMACGGVYTMQLPVEGQATDVTFTLKAPLDLATAKKPFLKYDVKALTIPEDAVVVQAEVRPAGKEWLAVGHEARGNHPFASSVVVDLTPYAGQAIGLRFHGKTLAGATDPKGLYLDDVAVIEPS